MTRVISFVLAALLVLAPLPAEAASSTVADAAGDQTHGDLWSKYRKQRKASDLRRARFAVASGKLTLTWTFADDPSLSRAYHSVGMSGHIKGKLLSISAWRHNGTSWTAVFTGLGDESKEYCAGKASVSLKPAKHQVVLKVPVKCLPKGKVITGPYPASYLGVLKKNGIYEGTVASDSSVAAPDLRIRS